MACNDCIHNGICLISYNDVTDEFENVEDCFSFEDKADFVKVIRCSKCSRWDSESGNCWLHDTDMNDEDFCNYGLMKGGEEE